MSGCGVLVFLFIFFIINVFLTYFLPIKEYCLWASKIACLFLWLFIRSGRKIFCQLEHDHAPGLSKGNLI